LLIEPLSNKRLQEEKAKRETPEGKLDKNGNPRTKLKMASCTLKGTRRKATTGTELTEYELKRNKAISKLRYIVEQYFGLSHLYNKANRARFPRMLKNAMDGLFRQMAFNLFRASKILKTA